MATQVGSYRSCIAEDAKGNLDTLAAILAEDIKAGRRHGDEEYASCLLDLWNRLNACSRSLDDFIVER